MRWRQPSFGSLTVGLAALCAAGLLAQEPPARDDGAAPTKRPAFAKVREPEVRRGLFEEWNASHHSAYSISPEGGPAATAVGRASMVINSSNTVFYTRQTPGSSCDIDENRCGNNNEQQYRQQSCHKLLPRIGLRRASGLCEYCHNP